MLIEKIEKVKLTTRGKLEVTYNDFEGNCVVYKGCNTVHQDVDSCFRALVPFAVALTEQKEAEYIDWSELDSDENKQLLKFIFVSAVNIKTDENEQTRVVLNCSRTTTDGRCFTFSTPSQEYESSWEHLAEFKHAVDALLNEAELYVNDHKCAGSLQQEINFDESDEAEPFAQVTPTKDVKPIATNFSA